MNDLERRLQGLPPALGKTLLAIADAVAEISIALRTASSEEAGSANTFGDRQLQADVLADQIIFDRLRSSQAVATASSEEQTDMADMGGSDYSVAFDPLDGSSIIGANFAVGSIFGIWPGKKLIGQKARDQHAAAYAIYGPKTIFMLALASGLAGQTGRCSEYTLLQLAGSNAQWQQSRADVRIQHKQVFAPANLRATASNPVYRHLVAEWMAQKYTLRYSGGMASDVHHILAKGGGIFCSPAAPAAPAKLRLLYEIAPLSFVVEAAGGTSHCGSGSVLQQDVDSAEQRSGISLGSLEEVERTVDSLKFSLQ